MSVDYEAIGFYVPIGSDDYPKAWNYDKPFGFNRNSDGSLSGPIFEKTLFDIENAFKYPVTINKRMWTEYSQNSDIGLTNMVSRMIYGTLQDPDVTGDPLPIPGTTAYNDLMKVASIMDYFWARSSKTNVAPDQQDITALNDLCTGLWGTSMWPQNINLFRASDIYGSNMNMNFSNRYGFILLRNVPIGGTVGLDDNGVRVGEGRLYDFKIYFIPDALYMIEEELLEKRLQVYYYEDIDGQRLIDNSEWNERIIEEQQDIFKNVKYKNRPDRLHVAPATSGTRYFEYFDPSLRNGGDNPRNSNSISGPLEFINRDFWVYHLFDELRPRNGESGIRYYVKKWLIDEKVKDRNGAAGVGTSRFTLPELQKMYPDLFMGSNIEIYFVKTGGHFTHPISLERLRNVLISQGIIAQSANFNNAEIITVGTQMDDVEVLIEPITAVAVNPMSEPTPMGPISDMFNYFVPLYGNQIIWPKNVSGTPREKQVIDFHDGLRCAARSLVEQTRIAPETWDESTEKGNYWIHRFIYDKTENPNLVTFDFTGTSTLNGETLAGVGVNCRIVEVN